MGGAPWAEQDLDPAAVASGWHMLGLKVARPPQGLSPVWSSVRLQRACRRPGGLWWLASVTVIFLSPSHGFQPPSWVLLEWFLE